MMVKASLVVAALSGLALAHEIEVPACANDCFTIAQGLIGCNPKEVECLCPHIDALSSADVISCLATACASDPNAISDLATAATEACTGGSGSTATDATTVTGTSSTTYTSVSSYAGNGTVSSGLYPNATTTHTGKTTETHSTMATTGSSGSTSRGSGSGGSSTNTAASATSTNAAVRSELGKAALGLAMAAALVL